MLQLMGPALLSGAVYFALVLAAAELARRGFRVPADVTRRSALALLSLWTVLGEPRAAAAAFLALALPMYLSFRYQLLASIEDDGPSPGSVLAPLSAALLLFVYGKESLEIAAAGAFAMGFGDGAAALVGRRRGTRRFRVLGHPRTMEGTLACFFVTSAAIAPVLALLGGIDWHQAVAFGLIAGTVAASVEALSIYGTDNVTVPLAVAATLSLLSLAS